MTALANCLQALVIALVASTPGQKKNPDVCPYCKNDPALLAAAGLVSHGPISIGWEGSESLVEKLPASQWLFLESTHIRWASSLSSESVKSKDRERLEGELARLRVLFPEIPEKVKRLDPYLRIHLMAQRGEEFYARFQKLLGVTDADFPESRQADGPYMGDGRYMGEKDKFEILIHVNRETHRMFTSTYMGVSVTDSLRWHIQGMHKVIASIPAVDPDIQYDRFLHPHVIHNLAHNMLCAYKHYSYDPPVWLDEGLAHAMEQEINHEFHTLDGEEGSMPDNRGPGDWDAELARISKRGKRTDFANLLRLQGFGQMSQDDHVSAYGLVRFLIDQKPTEFAAFIGAVKGKLDAKGFPNGSDMLELQREKLKELFGWTPAELDAAWGAWIEGRAL